MTLRIFSLLFTMALGTTPIAGQALFTKIVDPLNPATTFDNTAATYKGAVWIDLNQDNWPDLFVGQKFLFLNNRDGSFTRLPDLDGAALGQGAAGSSWADIDNDGHPDYISAGLISGIYRNNGDNTFTAHTGLLPDFMNYAAWDCALVDADNNGLLDIVFTHACCTFHPVPPVPCRFYLQKNSAVFERKTGYEFTDTTAAYTIPIWADYDLDGDMDLFIGSGPAGSAKPDFNYRNMLKETGTFGLQRLTDFPFLEPQDGQTYNFVDYDNDGDLDICLTNYTGAKTRFYQNNNGTYQSIATPFTIQIQMLTNVWGDVDNDGDLDVLMSVDGTTNIRFFRNKGDGTFAALKIAGTAGNPVSGIALADYDNDGDLDFYTNGPTTARSLFRNDTLAQGRHWVQFSLEGTISNRSAIGALIRVKAMINGKTTWQMRQVLAHNSFQSQSDLRQHFGLDQATLIDSVEVRWPSGKVEIFGPKVADSFYKIVEGEGIKIISTVAETPQTPSARIKPNPSPEAFSIETVVPIERLEIFDSTGRTVAAMVQITGNVASVKWPVGLSSGVYFTRAWLENGAAVVQQIMKM